ncbi:urease subunit alpha [Nonomuraea sp. NPDC001831]|uniref:urease subunit alpha n=1 Tax=Nonomuraea sp. NPDC001831 TaxID=3364340 RepID=UPI00369B3D55
MTTNAFQYAAVHGPTTGDLVRLGDSGLVVRVEHDAQRRGEEFLAGFGKTARDGMHLKAASVGGTCDLVISNVLVIDALLGIRKTSIGIRAGRICAVGRAGNPDTLDGVDVVVGTGTTIVPGEGMIATAGAVDTHVHLLSPRIMQASLESGVTTIIGQEFGPLWGVGVNSPWALRHAFNAFDAWPVNIGLLARGSSSDPAPLIEALDEGGASGFKVHEDMGAHTRALDTALRVAEDYDVQVALHSDGLNECLSVRDTLAVLDGRTIHAFHIEGCGGGHVPDVLALAGLPNVIGSSTNSRMRICSTRAQSSGMLSAAARALTRATPLSPNRARLCASFDSPPTAPGSTCQDRIVSSTCPPSARKRAAARRYRVKAR